MSDTATICKAEMQSAEGELYDIGVDVLEKRGVADINKFSAMAAGLDTSRGVQLYATYKRALVKFGKTA